LGYVTQLEGLNVSVYRDIRKVVIGTEDVDSGFPDFAEHRRAVASPAQTELKATDAGEQPSDASTSRCHHHGYCRTMRAANPLRRTRLHGHRRILLTMRTELSTTAATAERLRRQGRRHTSSELELRRELHRLWHGCPEHTTQPRSNAEWWRAKVDANCERDHRNAKALKDTVWSIVRIREREEPSSAVATTEKPVRRRRAEVLSSNNDRRRP
jgi:hypothetical protein